MTTFRGGIARAMALEAGHPDWWKLTSWTVKRLSGCPICEDGYICHQAPGYIVAEANDKVVYRVRVEDRHGDRWTIVADTLEAVADIVEVQGTKIVWVKPAGPVKRDPKPLSDGDECNCLNCAVGITK